MTILRDQALGLDNLLIEGGFHEERTAHGTAVVVEHVEALERVMAHAIARDERGLQGQEFRFLRAMLDMSQGAFGMLPGRDAQTVMRYENAKRGRGTVPLLPGTVMRLLYLESIDENASLLSTLDRAMGGSLDPVHDEGWHFRHDGTGWTGGPARVPPLS